MRLTKLIAKNYRSLEDVEIDFNPYYNALSGKNNSGKSNVIKVINSFLTHNYQFFTPYSKGPINYSTDYPYWKTAKDKSPINIEIHLELDRENDAGLYKFIRELIFKEEETVDTKTERLILKARVQPDSKTTEIEVFYGDHQIKDEYKRDELMNRIRSSESVLFHNSTENDEPYFMAQRRRDSLSSYLNADDLELITRKKSTLERAVKKSLKKHQTEFGSLLGRLTEKYDVSLGIPSFNIDRESIEISLKEKGIEVSLEDWGSGTKNRTLILLNLMNAKRIQESTNLNKRLTPIVIIEEPESFLHPSAQAEFGRILQDIAVEFKIQIIAATHSPYLLSHKEPKANLLLERDLSSNHKGSKIINTEGDKWYEPFALSLGISGEDFGPLKSTIFSGTSDIILVEGESDKRYFEILKQEQHGQNKLKFDGEIFSYGGAGNIKNNILLRFVKERFKRFVVTVDRDKILETKKTFESLGLKENKEFIVIGKNETGKKCIEGLVPATILSQVYAENVELVQQSQENSIEGKDARSKIKSKVLEKFETANEDDNPEMYKDFYKLSQILNKIFK